MSLKTPAFLMKVTNWPMIDPVSAYVTTRHGGYSKAPFDSFNLGQHVSDDPLDVEKNRGLLRQALPSEPQWLEQIHSNICVDADLDINRKADAIITRKKGTVLAVMTADCLPILLCHHEGHEVAAIHAGWKGLHLGIIEQTLLKLNDKPEQYQAWIGPAICQSCYEVDERLYQAFKESHPECLHHLAPKGNKWHANLAHIAADILNAHGLTQVYQSNLCTLEHDDFYSYRQNATTGRMASLIFIDS